MQLQTLISNGGSFKPSNTSDLSKLVKELLEKEVDEAIVDALDWFESNTLQERRIAAKWIVDSLNEFERRNPRKDPALRGLRTDQWRAYIYKVNTVDGKRVRNAKGQFDVTYRVQVWNMQKPFYYRFDFSRYVDRVSSGKMMLDIQTGSINSLKRDYLHTDLYQMPFSNKGTDPLYIQRRSEDPFNSAAKKKVGARTARGYVGNLAAVRLSQVTGRVLPKTDTNHTHRIVFWNNGRAQRLDKSGKKSVKGKPFNVEGYVFVTSRSKTGPGHRWYYNQIMTIINAGVNRWIDNIWRM